MRSAKKEKGERKTKKRSSSSSRTSSTNSTTLRRGRLDSLVRQIEAQASQAFRDRVASIIQTQTMQKQTNPNDVVNHEAMAYITAISNSIPVEIGARLNDVYNCIFNVNKLNNCTLNFNVSLLNDSEVTLVKNFLDEQSGRNLSTSATDLLTELNQ